MCSNLTVDSSSASYITARTPGKYGGKQDDYVFQSNEAIKAATSQIIDGAGEKKDLTALFFEVLEGLSVARQNIAIAHGTKSSASFGRRRELPIPAEEVAALKTSRFIGPYTCMDGPDYAEYNPLFMDRLYRVLSAMKHDKKAFSETSHVETKTVLGRVNKFAVEVLPPEAVSKLGKHVTIEELNAAIGMDCHKCETLLDFLNNKEAMFSLKTSNPELYKQLRMSHYLRALSTAYPSPKRIDHPFGGHDFVGDTGNLKSLFVLATNRLEMNGKLYPLSQYLTWMYCNWEEDPVDRMKERSKVMVIHQDTFLIEETLKDISHVFKEAILWNREEQSLPDLKNKVALLRYELSHSMPFDRGSAAISEWMETAIYRYHGFTEFCHSKTYLADLEALTSLSLADFLKRYDTTITLKL